MCSMLSTVVVRTRSNWVVSRPSISSGLRPVNCHATAITGMSMLGKISVGVRRMMTGLASRISSATTAKVYGRCSATLTIHMLCRRPRARPRYRPTSAAAANGNVGEHGRLGGVGVHAERVDQRPPDAGRSLDGVDNRPVIGVGHALQTGALLYTATLGAQPATDPLDL